MVKVGSKRNSALEANLRAGLLRAQVWGNCGRFARSSHCIALTGQVARPVTGLMRGEGSSLICIHSMQEGNNCQFSALVNIQSDNCAH